jgi:hypothetical protein
MKYNAEILKELKNDELTSQKIQETNAKIIPLMKQGT